MKKLLILLIAFSLFTACNNDKGPANDRDNRTNNNRDDYRSDDKDKDKDKDNDDRNNDDRDNDDRDNTNRDDDPPVDRDRDNNNSGNWTSRDRDEFVSSCVGEAVKGESMSRSKATSYCECMQVQLEKLYPNPSDVANIDINSSSMQKMVRDCLE